MTSVRKRSLCANRVQIISSTRTLSILYQHRKFGGVRGINGGRLHHDFERSRFPQRVSSQGVDAVHTSCNLTCGIEAWSWLGTRAKHDQVLINLQTTLATVDDWRDDGDKYGCAAKSSPRMTLWQNFFSEPVLPDASSHDLPLGYAMKGPPSGSFAVFKDA